MYTHSRLNPHLQKFEKNETGNLKFKDLYLETIEIAQYDSMMKI